MPYARHGTTRSSRYAHGGADVPIARLVVVLIIAVASFAVWRVFASPPEASATKDVSISSLRNLLRADDSQHFLPPPVAAIPPEVGAGPPAPAAGEAPAPKTPEERVKVADTGGLGAVLRAEPPRGRQVAALRDGQVLQVIERQTVADAEWIHVRTADGTEGWIFGRLVGPAE